MSDALDFSLYEQRFHHEVGALHVGQYGAFHGRLVPRLGAAEFQQRAQRYLSLGQQFCESVQRGDTTDEALIAQLRALEADLVLTESLFLPPMSPRKLP